MANLSEIDTRASALLTATQSVVDAAKSGDLNVTGTELSNLIDAAALLRDVCYSIDASLNAFGRDVAVPAGRYGG